MARFGSKFRMAMESANADLNTEVVNKTDDAIEISRVKELEDEIEIMNLAKETDEISEDGRMLNDMVWATQEVGEFREHLATAQESGGLTRGEAKAYRWGLECWARHYGLEGLAPVVATEAFAGSIGNRSDETFALEEESDNFLVRMWKTIKEWFSKMWEKIKSWFGSSKEKTEKACDKAAEKADALEKASGDDDKEFKLKYDPADKIEERLATSTRLFKKFLSVIHPDKRIKLKNINLEMAPGELDELIATISSANAEELKSFNSKDLYKECLDTISKELNLPKASSENGVDTYKSPAFLGGCNIIYKLDYNTGKVSDNLASIDEETGNLKGYMVKRDELIKLLRSLNKNKDSLKTMYDDYYKTIESAKKMVDSVLTDDSKLESISNPEAKKVAKEFISAMSTILSNCCSVMASGALFKYLGKLPGFIESINNASSSSIDDTQKKIEHKA